MTKEDVITVLEKELRCHNVYTEKGGTCPDDVDCSECECFVSDGTLHKAIKAAVDILKGGECYGNGKSHKCRERTKSMDST